MLEKERKVHNYVWGARGRLFESDHPTNENQGVRAI